MPTLYQYSHFLAVSHGCYDGLLSIKELKKKGDTGLGTFNSLDGELTVIDNQYYHCFNGQVRLADDDELLPWAATAQLKSTTRFSVENLNSIQELQEILLAHAPSANYPIALRISGDAANISLGSVPKQKKPYKTISQVIDDSILLNTGRIQVDMAGFYSPDFLFPMKSKGIHLHFVDQNRKIGGHVLELNMQSATVQFQLLDSMNLIFPQIEDYKLADLAIDADNTTLPKFEDKLNHGASIKD